MTTTAPSGQKLQATPVLHHRQAGKRRSRPAHPEHVVIRFIGSTGKAVVLVRHRIVTIVLGVGMAGLVAGCSSGSGTPQPSSPAPSSSSVDAPHVSNPLDTSKFQAAPCTVLSAAEAQSFGASVPGESKSDALGPSCVWRNRDTGASFYR
jgi:hypothetical protein